MGDVLVLCYHLVDPSCSDEMSVPPGRLRAQVAALLARGYLPRTFSDATAGAPPVDERRVLAVTFDDAFAGTWTHAAPVLAELGVVATVFVPSALVSRGRPMSWPGLERHALGERERMPMTWGQLEELVSVGWEVGSHTATHARLDECGTAELEAELVGSAAECEDRLGRRCATLAYPFGTAGGRVRQAARAAGYDRAAVLGRGGGPWAVPRVGVYQGDTAARLRVKVSRAARSSPAAAAIEAARGAVRRFR